MPYTHPTHLLLLHTLFPSRSRQTTRLAYVVARTRTNVTSVIPLSVHRNIYLSARGDLCACVSDISSGSQMFNAPCLLFYKNVPELSQIPRSYENSYTEGEEKTKQYMYEMKKVLVRKNGKNTAGGKTDSREVTEKS